MVASDFHTARQSFIQLASLLDQCLMHVGIVEKISSHADEINSYGYGQYFSIAQDSSLKISCLLLCNIFAESRRNKTNSISYVKMRLGNIAPCFRNLRLHISRADNVFGEVDQISDGELPRLMVEKIDSYVQGVAQSKLKAPKIFRDKHIAHSEFAAATVSSINVDEIRELLEFAEVFVGTVGASYFNIFYGDDTRWFIPPLASKTQASLERVLERCGISRRPSQG